MLRYLNEVAGVPAGRLSAVGYGHVKPLLAPGRPGSQELNKRVDIVVVSELGDAGRGLLAQQLTQQLTQQLAQQTASRAG